MKITMIAAISQNGLITDDENPNQFSWTSAEDKKHLSETVEKYPLIVMGSNTYKHNKGSKPGVLRIVLTKSPDLYLKDAIPGQLEFKSLTPHQLVKKYKDKFESCLLVGGATLYTEFLEAGLVDEAYITIEPKTFKSGISLLTNKKSIADYSFPNHESRVLNSSGTLLDHYWK